MVGDSRNPTFRGKNKNKEKGGKNLQAKKTSMGNTSLLPRSPKKRCSQRPVLEILSFLCLLLSC